jgi:hypothetical protein
VFLIFLFKNSRAWAGNFESFEPMGLEIVPDENCQSVPGFSETKKDSLNTKRARLPLKDSTNYGAAQVEVKVKLQSPSGAIEYSDSIGEKRGPPSSEASHEAVQLDSEGFVIWEDSQPQEIRVDLAEEVRTLKAALAEALEENKLVQFLISMEFFTADIYSFMLNWHARNVIRKS